MLSNFLSFVNTKGSSLSLPAHGWVGARATSFLAAHFAKQKTKFGGGGKARITRDIYDTKLKAYKEKQHDINIRLEEYTQADENFHIAASTVFSLTNRALKFSKVLKPTKNGNFSTSYFRTLNLSKKISYIN